jgi:hypothetical protein
MHSLHSEKWSTVTFLCVHTSWCGVQTNLEERLQKLADEKGEDVATTGPLSFDLCTVSSLGF